MMAKARRQRGLHRLRLPRQHELLATIIVASIVVAVVAHALRMPPHARTPYLPAAAIVR